MKLMSTTLRLGLLLLLSLAASAPALAGPHPSTLRAEIVRARAEHPAGFAAVDVIRRAVMASPPPRERRAQVGRAFRDLGPDGLLPLLAMVTPGSQALAGAPERVRELLVVGAVEAVGELADRRAQPILKQLFLDDGSAEVARAAAEALGQLGSAEEIVLLGDAISGPRAREAILGLGQCRRREAARRLVDRLASRPDVATVRALAAAMGRQGSSWAWEALGPARATEGAEVREALTTALAAAWLPAAPEARASIGFALRMIDHPTTAARLESLRASADPAARAALTTLVERLTTR